jgi:hypothetical protein
MAVASLVLGLLSFCLTFLTGIPAIVLGVTALVGINRSRGALTGKGMAIGGIVTGGLGCALVLVSVAILLPAIQGARESARRAVCQNNLKQIELAMLEYADAHHGFPPAFTLDPAAKPLLSWRVLILPYLGQQALYEQFKLDEPWDSPNNKPLVAQMPSVYRCPSLPQGSVRPGATIYQVLIGPGSLFERAEGMPLDQVTDGLANTFMVLETKVPSAWTQPSGLEFNRIRPTKGLGSAHPGGFSAGTADGAVHFIKASTPARTLQALTTRNGNEPVNLDEVH